MQTDYNIDIYMTNEKYGQVYDKNDILQNQVSEWELGFAMSLWFQFSSSLSRKTEMDTLFLSQVVFSLYFCPYIDVCCVSRH